MLLVGGHTSMFGLVVQLVLLPGSGAPGIGIWAKEVRYADNAISME
jgi:hypothetical protein